jgi:hypothetical protein
VLIAADVRYLYRLRIGSQFLGAPAFSNTDGW